VEPMDLTIEHEALLQLVYNEFREHNTWPRFGSLDRRVARYREPWNLAEVIRTLPPGFLLPLWSGSVPPRPDAEMRLTIDGVSTCQGSSQDIELFLVSLRWIARRELRFAPPANQPDAMFVVTSRQLMRALKLTAVHRPAVARLGHLLLVERWGWTTGSVANDWQWQFGVGRDARRFARLKSLNEYVDIRAGLAMESTRALVPGPTARSPASQEEVPAPGLSYVDGSAINDLKQSLLAGGWDPGKLLALLAELNDNHARGNAYACHALLRAILDHVPPAFGQPNFDAVVNNVDWTRTDKEYMKRLANFRLQADDALHRHISAKHDYLTIDDLPPRPWVRRLLAGPIGPSPRVATAPARRA
jgi:hypothetical protein